MSCFVAMGGMIFFLRKMISDASYVKKVTGKTDDKNPTLELGTIITHVCEEYGVMEGDLLDLGKQKIFGATGDCRVAGGEDKNGEHHKSLNLF